MKTQIRMKKQHEVHLHRILRRGRHLTVFLNHLKHSKVINNLMIHSAFVVVVV